MKIQTFILAFFLTFAIVYQSTAQEQKIEIYTLKHETPDQMPQFVGGAKALFQYISKNLRYPKNAAEYNIQGRVIVKFIITETGKIENIRVTKNLHYECDLEAYRVVNSMPDWIPAMIDGKPVKVEYTIPISFKLGKGGSGSYIRNKPIKAKDEYGITRGYK